MSECTVCNHDEHDGPCAAMCNADRCGCLTAKVSAKATLTVRGRVIRKDGSVEQITGVRPEIDEETLARLQRRQDEANQGG